MPGENLTLKLELDPGCPVRITGWKIPLRPWHTTTSAPVAPLRIDIFYSISAIYPFHSALSADRYARGMLLPI